MDIEMDRDRDTDKTGDRDTERDEDTNMDVDRESGNGMQYLRDQLASAVSRGESGKGTCSITNLNMRMKYYE